MLEEALIVAIDDEHTVEVVDLMLNGDSEKSARGEGLSFSVFIRIIDGHGLESFDGEKFSREGEASFFEENAILLMTTHGGVDEYESLFVYLDHR